MSKGAQAILHLRDTHKIRVEADFWTKDDIFPVRFIAGDKEWEIFIEDEYGDFDPKKQLVCIYLVLKALEEYATKTDFAHWCRYYAEDEFDPVNQKHFASLASKYAEIESILGEINSYISWYDYDYKEGAFLDLLEYED